MESLQVSKRVAFVEFDWKYYIFLNTKMEEWHLKTLLFLYWNDLALGSVETSFLEDGAYVSLKVSGRVVFADFDWKYHIFLNIKNGGVKPNNFFVYLLKWSCLRLSINIFFGSRCIRVSERSHHRCLRETFLLNFNGNFIFF